MNHIDLDDFLQYVTVKKRLNPGSVRICRQRVGLLLKYLAEYNLSLIGSVVEKFLFDLRQKGYKNNSVNSYIFSFRYLQDYCNDRKNGIQFFDNITLLPKNKTFTKILTPAEIETLLSTFLTYGVYRGKDYTRELNLLNLLITGFLVFTGCRFEEAQNLRVKHLDLDRGTAIFVDTKNGLNRTIDIVHPPLIADLKSYIQEKSEDDLVFTNMAGNMVHHSDFSLDLKRRAQKAGIKKPVSPHKFRHSHASTLYRAGVGLKTISDILGHTNVKTTMDTYIHDPDNAVYLAMAKHPLTAKHLSPQERIRPIEEFIMLYTLNKDDVNALIGFLKTRYFSA